MKLTRFRAVGALGVLVGAASLVIPASPASAVVAGKGTSVGETSIDEANTPPALPPCLKAKAGMTATLYNTGTFTAQTAVFSGTTKTVFAAGTSTFYFNPAGTFSDPACHMPYAVPGSITVTTVPPPLGAPPNEGTASCPTTAGTYQRVGNDYVIKTTANTLCSVTSPPPVGTSGSESSSLVFAGNENPCFDNFVVSVPNCGTVPNSEMQGTYTQNP